MVTNTSNIKCKKGLLKSTEKTDGKSFKGLKWNKIENYAKHLKKDPKDTIRKQKVYSSEKLFTDEANISSVKEL